jgi:hypothetical protein
MLVTLFLALVLVPVAWVTRERQRLLQARDEAVRAVILAERYRSELKKREAAVPAEPGPADLPGAETPKTARSAGDPAVIERLRRENAELKAIVERLRRQVERLEAMMNLSGSNPSGDRVPPQSARPAQAELPSR